MEYKTNIISFSGQKQSGKNTATNILAGMAWKHVGYVNKYGINTDGKLVIYNFGMRDFREPKVFDWMNIENNDRELRDLINNCVVDPEHIVYNLSFAEPLKDAVSSIFGVEREFLDGKEEDKERKTVCSSVNAIELFGKYFPVNKSSLSKDGRLKIRELMVVFGEMCKYISPTCFIDRVREKVYNIVEKYRPLFITISDARFDEEKQNITEWGGKIIGLKRSISQPKNVAEVINFDDCDIVIDNNTPLSIFCEILERQFKELYPFLETKI